MSIEDHTHIDSADGSDAIDPTVGEGTPESAPSRQPNDWDELAKNNWRPNRKWVVARITAIAAILTMWQVTGGWDAEETIALIGLVAEGAISYLTPNVETDE